MTEEQQQEIAEYILDKGLYSFGLSKIDTAVFNIEDIERTFGIFEKEIEEFVYFLNGLNVLDKVEYATLQEIYGNPKLNGNAYYATVSIPRLKGFTKYGKNYEKNNYLEEEKIQTSEEKQGAMTSLKDGIGYFKFYKQGENIKIGKENTRQFKLLQCLTDPSFGIRKTIESVFEAIKKAKDENNTKLSLFGQQKKEEMLNIIENTTKELQKIEKLQGKITYCFDDRKQNMWLE